jgi:hypothetical protein
VQTEQLTFHPHRPCGTPQEHVGRESLVQHAYGRLGTDDVQSFAVIGFHHEGKSSFVKYIQQPKVAKRYLGDNASQYIFLYFDLAEQPLNDETAFFKEFYRRVGETLSLSGPLDFDKITDWLVTQQRRLVLTFDNFNYIVTNPNYKVAFYEGLRSWLSTHPQIGCIVTSPVQLLRLAIPQELAGSPFFNIFDSYSLSPLSFTEATKLVYDRLPEKLGEREKDIFELITQVGHSPYPLQQAGYIWVTHLEKSGKPAFKQVIDEVYQACLPYYQEIYASLKKNQLENIVGILSHHVPQRIDHTLIDRGWITKDKSRMVAQLMERFFRERMGIPDKKNPLKGLKNLWSNLFD